MRRKEWDALRRDERRAYAKPGTKCIEAGCEEPAGTPWGPYWCADHDDERIRRISRNLEEMGAAIREEKP